MTYHVFVLVAAILLFGVLAFRQMNALLLATLVTIFVSVLSGMPVLDTLLKATRHAPPGSDAAVPAEPQRPHPRKRAAA